MNIFTIGFTGKTAEKFFGLLSNSHATKLIDIRINRTSQLAGFAKEQDLKYFLPKLIGMEYLVREDFAPTKELLASYRNSEIDWSAFAKGYSDLIVSRKALDNLDLLEFSNAVLLCSESEPEKCHRTLLTNLLIERNSNFKIINLL